MTKEEIAEDLKQLKSFLFNCSKMLYKSAQNRKKRSIVVLKPGDFE